ncbi:HTH-type transcriptional repressor CarH [Burkholderiaceae bacterium]|nr:HTH-type transcriptional repressor CarH [Burkholderiaceae bacterium]
MKESARFNISAVEGDVGLSKDVLRVWERRYGFPTPERDANGERLYSAEQVKRLRLIKRLMDLGHRPGRLLTSPLKELEALSSTHKSAAAACDPEGSAGGVADLIQLIRQHDGAAYLHALQQQLARQGLRHFVQDTVTPLTVQVGTAWEEGRLHVFEEHLYTELTTRTLRQAIAAVPGGREPKVLLTTLPNERHGMGLLMVEAMLSLEGAQCISLGTQMPLMEIAQAAAAHRADVVALSFSSAFPARQVSDLVQQLRGALPRATQLWAGGAGVRKLAATPGVLVLATLDDAVEAVAQWRAR